MGCVFNVSECRCVRSGERDRQIEEACGARCVCLLESSCVCVSKVQRGQWNLDFLQYKSIKCAKRSVSAILFNVLLIHEQWWMAKYMHIISKPSNTVHPCQMSHFRVLACSGCPWVKPEDASCTIINSWHPFCKSIPCPPFVSLHLVESSKG